MLESNDVNGQDSAEPQAGELVLIDNALKGFDKIRAGFAMMERNYKGVLFDVETSMGMDHAKAARAAIRKPRYEVENLRKGAKAPLLALGRRLDAVAESLTKDLLAIEEPIHLQIKSEEDRAERERLAQAAAELARKTAIEARIQDIRNAITSIPGAADADTIAAKIESIRAIEVNDTFAEYKQQAQDAHTAALARLSELHSAAVEREAEKKRIADQLAELAALKAANAERERKAAEEQARKDAEAAAENARLELERGRKAAESQALIDAENARVAEANRIESARIAEESRIERERQVAEARAHAQRIAAERAENDRIAAERQAELDRQAEVQRKVAAEEENRQAAERARLEADKADLAAQQEVIRKAAEAKLPKARGKIPTQQELVDAVAASYGVSDGKARSWISAYDWQKNEVAA